MKILLAAETLHPILGGADMSAKILLDALVEAGHDVHALYIGEKFDAKYALYPQKLKRSKGLWYRGWRLCSEWKKILDAKIKEIRPDWIITHDLVLPYSIDVVKQNNIKVLAYLRNTFHLSINGFMPFSFKSMKTYLQYPFFRWHKNYTKRVLEKADAVCLVTYAMKRVTEKEYNVNAVVLKPYVKEMNKERIKTTKEYITMFNPDKHKGYPMFRKIAKKCPDKKFLAVGKNIKESIKNIKILPWVDDIKSIHAISSVLCVPSQWFEPCSRVPIEGMATLTPTVVANKGGMPEATIPELVVNNYDDVDEWIEKINLASRKDFTEKIKKLRKNFNFKIEFQKFLKLLKN